MSTNEGRKILVVGGACGMGAATVAALYRQGANLIVLDINEEAMDLVSYVHGKYRLLSDVTGFFGYAVASPEAKARWGFKEEKK